MSQPLVLITGATGFLGSHILHQALEAGYPVRITTRPAKVDAMQKFLGDKVEVVGIVDAATGDYTEALKGVGAIIHCAAPIASKADPEGLLRGAIDGAMTILKQAVAAGIKKIVITSSWATVNFDPKVHFTDYVYTDKDWNPATREQALDGTRTQGWAYAAAKTIAEQEVWKFADEHPEIDITTINPPYLYGPFVPEFKLEKGDVLGLSTNGYFYRNVLPAHGGKLPAVQEVTPITIDVRDAAKAHILALRSPSTKEVGRKRLLIGGTNFTWKNAVDHLASVRPALRARFPDTSEALSPTIAKIDNTRATAVLGLTFTDWRKTVEDTADTLLAVEKSWAA
ncbi:NAD-P-binding protein [Rickenella mellea]|uniref:NAD-P-binding protein n=1 Tax=Rickenella mellea TaxID=50990 RepID=A0A4Y7QJL6_9AGAM|nr:NAD-P-binding protein [Rickenella mellea]